MPAWPLLAATVIAVMDAAVARLRPVVLAAATTVLGVATLLPEVFWVATAVTITFGLAFGTVLTMILLPVLYACFYGIRFPEASCCLPLRPLRPFMSTDLSAAPTQGVAWADIAVPLRGEKFHTPLGPRLPKAAGFEERSIELLSPLAGGDAGNDNHAVA